jgi:hypothetical protein
MIGPLPTAPGGFNSLGGRRQVHQVDRSQVDHMPQGRQSTRLPR